MGVVTRSLSYEPRGARLFARMRQLPWAMWLDSGGPEAALGRYEIFVGQPHTTLVSGNGETRIEGRHGRPVTAEAPLALLDELLAAQSHPGNPLPFSGGAVGYFGYDLGMRLEGVVPRQSAANLPEMAVGFYDWAVVTDHHQRSTYWVGEQAEYPLWRDLLAAPCPMPALQAFRAGAVAHEMSREQYSAAFDRIKRYIRAGDCYQVNLAQPFSAPYTGDPFEAYTRLRAYNPAPYGAYLELPFAHVLSSSPERFIELQGDAVLTRPIKGTRPRRGDPVADRHERDSLVSSAKDRAENVMIVDLLRNDLGKSCALGSVRVSELCALESFASVHHLVSTVRGRLRGDLTAVDLLRGCLPGGSITGAPKRRAMEIIAELETGSREIYCGAIGYLGYDGGMSTNIAIRTAVCAQNTMRFWAGGGVVADSTLNDEYQETLDKAAAFRRLLHPH